MKTAIVTGAARGIGLATARKFLAEGWAVALLDIEDATQADCPQTTLALRCDVSDPAAVEAAVAAVGQRFGRIDALVNNAGIAIFKPLLETSLEEWNRVLAVNLTGPFIMAQAVAPWTPR